MAAHPCLIPAATPSAPLASRAGGPGLPAAATRELIDILAAMTLTPAR